MNLLHRFLVIGGLLVASHAFGAEAFEGKVSFALTSDRGHTQNMDYSMKGRKLRMDMDAQGRTVSSIMDLEKLEMTMLMPEQGMYMVMPIKKPVEQAAQSANEGTAEVERTGRTETILGYKCDELVVMDKGTTTNMWVASDLGTFMGLGGGGGPPSGGGLGAMFGGGHKASSPAAAKWEEVLKGKGGFPLRVISHDSKGKETFKMEVTKIQPESLPDTLFVPDPGLKKFQMPDLGGMFRHN
ncbi:MAG TPA: DUF4412 domain-containing protein [Lacunisphaera sp.]|jgi:hypothetical protein|nr:DUF4412 domain-containing protein [Lacunisphaera sp.]